MGKHDGKSEPKRDGKIEVVETAEARMLRQIEEAPFRAATIDSLDEATGKMHTRVYAEERCADSVPEQKGDPAKAIHLLSKATLSLSPTHPLVNVLRDEVAKVAANGIKAETETMSRTAAALELDHNAAGAARDVRAAIEALR